MKSLATMLLVFGLPAAVWAQVSLMREMERVIRRCSKCTVCKAAAAEEARNEKEGRFRDLKLCVRGHGKLNSSGVCNTCGWS